MDKARSPRFSALPFSGGVLALEIRQTFDLKKRLPIGKAIFANAADTFERLQQPKPELKMYPLCMHSVKVITTGNLSVSRVWHPQWTVILAIEQKIPLKLVLHCSAWSPDPPRYINLRSLRGSSSRVRSERLGFT
jgi:hypothetical protein